MKWFENFTLNKKLTLLALGLGFPVLFMTSPLESADVTLSTKELALIVESKADHITVDELADWIIKGKADYRLIDLNEEKVYNEYHIPGAENISITNLMDADILRNEKIVLYSDGGIHAAQAWFLLKAKKYKYVYTLLGGLDEWKDAVLYPVIPDSIPAGEEGKYYLLKERSVFFGGMPVTSGNTESTVKSAPPLPKLPVPSATVPGGNAPKKKKKEGC